MTSEEIAAAMDALDRALALGALVTRSADGAQVTYRSVDEMMAVRGRLARLQAAAASPAMQATVGAFGRD